MSIFVNNTFPRRSLSRLAGVCAALLLEKVLHREAG